MGEERIERETRPGGVNSGWPQSGKKEKKEGTRKLVRRRHHPGKAVALRISLSLYTYMIKSRLTCV